MKRRMLGGLSLAATVLSLGLLGCGGGVEEGVPQDLTKKPVPPDPKWMDMTGKMGPGAAAAAAKGQAEARAKMKNEPAPGEPEKK
jgi:hypothetical protein